MNKNWYLGLMALGLHCISSANFSIRLNVGISSIGHETKALLLETYDEILAYETLENFRGTTQADFADLSKNQALSKPVSSIFIDEDNTTKAWSSSTTQVTLTPIVIASDNASFKIPDITLLTGTDATQLDQTDDLATSTLVVTASNGLVFSNASLPKYTSLDNGLTNNSYNPHYNTAYIVSTGAFTKLENLRNELLKSVESKSNHLHAQKHYQSVDTGISTSYDFGKIHMFMNLNARYPVDFIPRESIDIISFTPGLSLDSSLGAMINYGRGHIGASFGVSQIKGTFTLKKYKRLTTDNADLELNYVDYTNSYSLGNDTVTISSIDDLFYYGELRAETLPLQNKGLTIYGSYKLGFGRENEDITLEKLDLKQDIVTIGLSFAFMDK